MGLLKKIGKVVKKAAPVALGAAGAYFGAPYVHSAYEALTGGGPTELGLAGTDTGKWTNADANGNFGRIEVPGGQAFDYNPLIAGGAKLIGGQQTNVANAKQAQAQMDFQASQTGSAHQREVADLRAAGLNPILSAGGSGAMSGGGAQATMQDVIGPSVSSALEVQRATDDHRNSRSADKLLKAQEKKTIVETNSTAADIPYKIHAAREMMARAGITENDFAQTQNKSDIYSGTFGKILSYVEAITKALGLNTNVGAGYNTGSHTSTNTSLRKPSGFQTGKN